MKLRRKHFKKPNPEWLSRRLANKKIYRSDDVAVLLGNDVKNVHELVRRGRLKPIPDKWPYLFESSTVKEFRRQKPGRKPKPKPKLKRFIPKLKFRTEGGGKPKVPRPKRDRC